jgi:hypothetical protein
MHIYISICVTLLTLMAGLHLLIKIKKEGMKRIYQWITCLLLTVGVLILICQLWCACGQMCCRDKQECGMEMNDCGPGMMGGHGGMMMKHGGMMKCCDMDMKECGDMKMTCDTDSTGHRVECKVIIMDKEHGEKHDDDKHEMHEEKK